MPLIVAIEPDASQASLLAAVARELRAELVLGESAAKALGALGDRTPQLILTPALLPARDEAALEKRLRQLRAAGATVQTVTTPVLAVVEKKSKKKGGLFRRQADDAPAAEGCDTKVFAGELAGYL